MLAHFTKEVVFLGLREVWVSLSAGFGAFEKMKCIFSIAPVGNLEKSRECFSLRNTHRTLASGALDAESERPVQTLPGPARVRHRTTGTGRRPVRPVVRVRCEVCFAVLPGFKSDEHRTVRC